MSIEISRIMIRHSESTSDREVYGLFYILDLWTGGRVLASGFDDYMKAAEKARELRNEFPGDVTVITEK